MKENKKRIIPLVSRELGLRCLKAIVKEGYNIPVFYTYKYETDKKTIRPLYREFQRLAHTYNLNFICIDIMAGLDYESLVTKYETDFILMVCWREKLTERVIDHPKIACLNMHRSLLPKYKGGKPLVRALEAGEKETGATIHYVSPEIDSGRIIAQTKIPIKEGDTVKDLFNRLYEPYVNMMVETLAELSK